mmetsp:Transcript_8714/g.12736  ORF Transcript_8714/g.12736 Transcript_8714/m.12736 type:complete len:104 (-) Transcript_8714:111-422(-)
MIAPSPEWLVGLTGTTKVCNESTGEFIDMEKLLTPFDAGTDGGSTYTAGNDPLDPWEPIRLAEPPSERVIEQYGFLNLRLTKTLCPGKRLRQAPRRQPQRLLL